MYKALPELPLIKVFTFILYSLVLNRLSLLIIAEKSLQLKNKWRSLVKRQLPFPYYFMIRQVFNREPVDILKGLGKNLPST